MREDDTILDTESSAKVENLRTAEAEDMKQEDIPIGDEFQEKGAGGAAEKPAPSISTDSGNIKFFDKRDRLLYESRIAEAFGLPRKYLVAFREARLKRRDDWVTYQRAVVYTELGFEKAKMWYGKFAGAGAENIEIKSDKEFRFLKVYKMTKNPKLLLAVGVDDEISNRKKLPAPQIIQRIKVGLSKEWCPGMIIRCRRLNGNLWIYRGKIPQANTKHRFFAKPKQNRAVSHRKPAGLLEDVLKNDNSS